MLAGSLLACDMGGASLAGELTEDSQAALLGGMITSSMLGVTVTFTVPVAMGMLSREDRSFAAKGILCGIVTVPLGVLVGGLVIGCPIGMLLRNLLSILWLPLLIALGLWKFERVLIRGFTVFGVLVTALSTVGLLLGLLQSLAGVTLLPAMAPLSEALLTVGEISILLAGAFPLMWLITKLLRRPVLRLGARRGVNEPSVMGLLSTLVNSIATFENVEKMDVRGKVLNMAFAVSAAFVFGDHLAFCAGVAPEAILGLIAGKLVAGVSALGLALWLTRGDKMKSAAVVEQQEETNV